MRRLPDSFSNSDVTICPYTGKFGHPSKAAAKRRIKHLRGQGHDSRRHPLKPYQCKCGRWHVGHQPSSEKVTA